MVMENQLEEFNNANEEFLNYLIERDLYEEVEDDEKTRFGKLENNAHSHITIESLVGNR